ncbi:MAG: dTMP kinase [Chloroflexota bacterium]|nr:dTMP kinase [Chloroflexota bacterium]
MFISFEGPDGSGKTTQAGLLCQALEAKGLNVVQTREPGGTSIGEQIRGLLHDMANEAMVPKTESLLYSAARAQHVEEVIIPALERGAIVVSDRYAESTLAYQGYGHGLALETLERITDFATAGIYPDLVIYLDLAVAEGLGRKRRDRREGRGEWNRMDQQELAFHRRVREGYLEMARRDHPRWLVLDASRPVEALHQAILDRVLELLAESNRADIMDLSEA